VVVTGHHEVAGRAVAIAAADLAGWGGFATVLAGLLALAAGSGWLTALLLLVLGGAATGLLCWAAGSHRRDQDDRPDRHDRPATDPVRSEPGPAGTGAATGTGEPPITA
jgi:hypothetical protein